MRIAVILALLLESFMGAMALGQDGAAVEIQELIDQPTAGILEKGQYGFDARLYPYGGALAGLRAGLFERFMIGVSYGGRNVIGRGDPEWNELPGVLIKYRLFEETLLPAVVLGFDNQGFGLWSDSLNRYEVKAKGLFAVFSKNFSMGWLGSLGVHGGVNYNSFEDDDDRNLNGFAGFDKSLGEPISILAEYNLALDDNTWEALGNNRGYLNAGLRWHFAKQLSIEADFKDLLQNQKGVDSVGREVRIIYVETL
jgi:hypothetical protein